MKTCYSHENIIPDTYPCSSQFKKWYVLNFIISRLRSFSSNIFLAVSHQTSEMGGWVVWRLVVRLRTFCEKCLSNRSERGAQWLKSLPCGCCCYCCCNCCFFCVFRCSWHYTCNQQISHVDFSAEIAAALRRFALPIKVSVWLWLGEFPRQGHNSTICSAA